MSMRSIRLGGVTPVPWLSRQKLITLVVLGVVGVMMMVVIILTANLYVTLAFIVVVGVIFLIARRRGADGGWWMLALGEKLRSAIGTRARWDDFDPELEEQPFLLMDPLKVVAIPAGDGSELAVLDYKSAMVCVLEVSGAPTGVRNDTDLRRTEDRVVSIHRTLADPKTCVEQIDWITIVRPESAERIAQGMNAHTDVARPQVPTPVAVSMEEVPQRLAEVSERFRSYAVVRFNVDRLFTFVAQQPFSASSGAEAAYDAVAKVARMLTGKGVTVLGGLGPAQVTALGRAILSPDRSPDDLSGCEGDFWAGWPSWRRDGDVIISSCDGEEWMHATSAFGLHDWPQIAVQGRWMEPLVFGHGLGPRTVVSQTRLVPRLKARQLAKSQLTTAKTATLVKDRSGEVDGGEAWSQELTATYVAKDIVRDRHVGIMPSVRVLVSARTPLALRTAREEIDTATGDRMNCEGITSDETRPGVGLLRCLPLGLQVAVK